MRLFRRFVSVVLLFIAGSPTALWSQAVPATSESNVFRRPALFEASHGMQLRAILLARNGQLPDALKACQEAARLAPFSSVAQYNLGCIYATSGDPEEALKKIRLAIELGFRDAKLIVNDPDLESLRKRPEFEALIEDAKQPFAAPNPHPSPLQDSIGWVGPENTIWEEATNLLKTGFDWKRPKRPASISAEQNELGRRLKRWFAEGTAAGHFGDLYDNCDRDHSNMNYGMFPQLTRIEYRPEIAAESPFGLQNRFLHGGVVLGNASTSLVYSPFWRSNPRIAYTKTADVVTLTRQYFKNHLYVYPEHTDHDPGHNGEGGGHGDLYPANTPYLLISQGSSGSDQTFLHALAATMAAFRPNVKERLVENGMLPATLQQIFRMNYKLVRKPDDYFTGVAHPSAFDGTQVDALKMAEAAHAMTLETIPPAIRIRVEQQDRSQMGRDYFDVGDREVLFDTPCAIARIGRSVAYQRRMIISARESFDLDKRPLKFKWVVLRGDESLISLKPLDDEGSRAEVTVAWHTRRKTHPDSNIESNRVDIGVFAHNGASWSAPAFISWTFLDNEEREYDDNGRILSVTYHGGTDKGNYADPLIQTPKTWKDTYHYAEDGRLTGWTRTRGAAPDLKKDEFSAEGGTIIERDQLGRVLAIRGVIYLAQKAENEPLPFLNYQPTDEVLRFTYANDEDKIGRITSKEKIAP